MAAHKLPKDTPELQEIRQKAIQQATSLATQAPMGVAQKSLRVLELAEQVVQFGNVNALSDGATGAALAQAAITGAGYNIRINSQELPSSQVAPFLAELAGIEQQAAGIESHIRSLVHTHGM
jgi:formiminotetrahydrofolate cyclodeaminase